MLSETWRLVCIARSSAALRATHNQLSRHLTSCGDSLLGLQQAAQDSEAGSSCQSAIRCPNDAGSSLQSGQAVAGSPLQCERAEWPVVSATQTLCAAASPADRHARWWQSSWRGVLHQRAYSSHSQTRRASSGPGTAPAAASAASTQPTAGKRRPKKPKQGQAPKAGAPAATASAAAGEPLPAASTAAPAGASKAPLSKAAARKADKAARSERNRADRAATKAAEAQRKAAAREELEEAEATLQATLSDPRRQLMAAATDGALSEADVTKYYDVSRGLLPEAFRPFYADFPEAVSRDADKVPKGGCAGLQAEFEASGVDCLMYREVLHDLFGRVEARRQRRLYLDGPPGAGKSIALAALVHWARSHGWLALYVPAGRVLTQGGTFQRAPDGLWDTPEAAKLLLASLQRAHADRLQELTPEGAERSLGEVVAEGLARAEHACAAAVAALEGLQRLTGTPVLIAIDEYNALYSTTEYGEWESYHKRRVIQPHELRLVAALRLLEQADTGGAVVVGAAAYGGGISPRVPVPLAPLPSAGRVARSVRAGVVAVPPFSLAEVEKMLLAYWAQGTLACEPSAQMVVDAYHLTQGNARELRRLGDAIHLPLGLPDLARVR